MILENDNVRFILGPTNTGKTHLATERILSHSSGIIGLPLRLLAREIYDKLVKKQGRLKVALITGEQKILPSTARYFVCTVEAIPTNLIVDFIAIDEIQLASDPERGHVFTNRLLTMRGRIETIFMGAETMNPIIKKLFPHAKITYLQRRSSLTYRGKIKLSNLPKRSAVIAFNTADVYSIAEHMRINHGGAAIVLGSLSPQTRNAQVKMYDEGEVDYIVATDAIGMGLNLNIDHVALSSTRKFDGKKSRNLRPDEIAQIAGRAGRNLSNGTFGETANCLLFNNYIVKSIESNNFEFINFLYWRTNKLDFSNINNLLGSLEKKSSNSLLVRVKNADDEHFLKQLSQVSRIKKYLHSYDSVKLLWEVCSIPDYQKNLDNSHIDLLTKIFLYLTEDKSLPLDWIIKEIENLKSTRGSIDMLVVRLAKTRIWNYVSNKINWIKDSSTLKSMAQETEDILSNSLHSRLIEKFVDKKTSKILKKIKKKDDEKNSELKIHNSGVVILGEIKIGVIEGLSFFPHENINYFENKKLKKAINKEISKEMNNLATNIIFSENPSLIIKNDNYIYWKNQMIAKIKSGSKPENPFLYINKGDLLIYKNQTLLRKKLQRFVNLKSEFAFSPFKRIKNPEIKGISKGICFRLMETYGIFPLSDIANYLKLITKEEFTALKSLGINIGTKYVFLNNLDNTKKAEIRWILIHVYKNKKVLPFPKSQIVKNNDSPELAWNTTGYIKAKNIRVKINLLEKVAYYLVKNFSQQKIFQLHYHHFKNIKMSPRELTLIVESLGYKKISGTHNKSFWTKNKMRSQKKYFNKYAPFASLNKLQ